MADQSKSAWGCSDVIWLLVLTFNIGFFVGIPALAKLLGQDPEKMHWGLKLLGIPFGLIIGGLIMYVISKGEILATLVGGIVLMIVLIIKGLYLWMIVAGIAFVLGAVVCLVISRRKMNDAESAKFIGLIDSDRMPWPDPLELNNPLEQFSRLQEHLGSIESKSDKLRKHAALFGFNGLAGLAIGLTMLIIGLIKHL